MNIKKEYKKEYKKYVKINSRDDYSFCCISVGEKVMKFLDNEKVSPEAAFNKGIKDSGITGFMAGCIAGTVSKFHIRGEEFRKWWNIENQIKDEGEKANQKEGAVLNPALMTIEI